MNKYSKISMALFLTLIPISTPAPLDPKEDGIPSEATRTSQRLDFSPTSPDLELLNLPASVREQKPRRSTYTADEEYQAALTKYNGDIETPARVKAIDDLYQAKRDTNGALKKVLKHNTRRTTEESREGLAMFKERMEWAKADLMKLRGLTDPELKFTEVDSLFSSCPLLYAILNQASQNRFRVPGVPTSWAKPDDKRLRFKMDFYKIEIVLSSLRKLLKIEEFERRTMIINLSNRQLFEYIRTLEDTLRVLRINTDRLREYYLR